MGGTSSRPPAHDEHLQRQRLVRLLDDATTRPLTIVSAPAGYGKTVAVRQFIEAGRRPAVWPALHDARSPAETWHQACDELARLPPTGAGGTTATALPGAHDHAVPDDGSSPLDTLLSLASRLRERTILVLDGLDTRDRQGGNGPAPTWDTLWEQVTYLVDNLPPPLRLIVVTRRSPALPLGRWRTQGALAELGHEELGLRPAEARELLERQGHGDIAGRHVLALTDRTEGWPLGLGLLLRGRDAAASRALDAVTSRALDADAALSLLAEILRGQPAEVEDFLVTTSILDRFTASTCRAVTGRDDAGRLLRAVEEANLFVIPLDEDREWFRYQRFFAELLREELAMRSPAAVSRLHQSAATWFKEHRDVRQALKHLRGAGRTGQALSLANEDAYRSWWESSFLGTDWSELFPSDWVGDDPERMIDFALLLGRSGHVQQTKSWLDRAEKDLQGLPGEHPGHLSLLAAKALWHAVHMHAGSTVDLAHRALEKLEAGAPSQVGSTLLRDRLLVALLNSYWLLDDLDGVAHVCNLLDTEPAPGTQPSPGVMRDIVVPASRARLALRRGQLHDAYEMGQSVLHTTRMMGLPRHPARRDAELAVGGVVAEWGDIEQAEDLISPAIHDRDKVGWVGVSAATRIELARARALCRGPGSGLSAIEEARAVIRGHPVGQELIHALDACEARLRIDLDDLRTAGRLLAGLPPGTRRTLLEVRLALARGDASEAVDRLTTLTPETPRQRVVTNLLAARVADALGKQADRDRYLGNALALGTEEGFRRTFAIEAPELTRLTDRFDVRPLSGGDVHDDEPVTDRERSVLRYLPSRLTNREIATELEVSGNTLKTHLRSLYRKLGVSSRTDAVIEAKRAGLL